MSVSDRWLVGFLLSWVGQSVWFFIAGLWEWSVLWLVILLTVGIAELWSKLASGLTLTQKFRRRFQSDLAVGYVMLAFMGVSWAFLLLHLGWR
mgnify:CR=1 FL=1